jgi:3-hydroxyacyl-[acyl-carrier-protein] dehydratase
MASWQPQLESSSPDEVTAVEVAAAGSSFFEGHFPGDPILPGVAMLALVEQTLRDFVLPEPAATGIAVMRRVRFKQLVRPGSPLRVRITRTAPRMYSFELQANGQPAAQGLLELSEGLS